MFGVTLGPAQTIAYTDVIPDLIEDPIHVT
ncbi:hypothetical protein FIV00_10185 [Labrenzia sp. THAF82]|nr:hypothetical protein FIV00_10185 [Labrenzia sp. THAF82]